MVSKFKELLLQNRNTRQTIAKNIFWLTTGQIGSRLFRAIIIIYAARVLGAGEYGVFAYVLGLASFFTIFADVGINSILTREAAKKPDEASYYFATTFWIKITLLLFTAALIIFLAPYFSKIEAAKALLPLVALLTAFDGIRELCNAFFRAKQKMELEALVATGTNIAIAVFGFIILYFAASAKSLATAYVLSASAGTLIGIIILRAQFSRIISFFRKYLVRPILTSAWPIALMGVMGVFMLQVDILMIGFFRTATEVGLYSAGQKIGQLLYTLPAILAATLFPILAGFVGKNDNTKTKLLMERGITAALLIAIPIVAGGLILGKDIINLLYGSEYLPSTPVFQILILTLLVAFPGPLIGNYIFGYDKQKKMAPIVALGAVSNVILNAALIPLYGIVGAAVATVAAQLVYNGLSWRLAKKINNFYILRHLKKIITGVIIMGIFTLILDKLGINVIFNIILSAGIYLGALYLLKEKTLLEVKSLVQSR